MQFSRAVGAAFGTALASVVLFATLGWLAPDALCVIEDAADAALDLPPSFAALDRRAYGDTQVIIAKYSPA